MPSGSEGTPSLYASPTPAFELERFTWSGPDRLEVVGRFAGLAEGLGEPVLVVRGAAGVQELAVVDDSVRGASADGERWRAHFAWPDAPSAFDTAQLRFGDGLVVELPDPPGRRRPFGRRHLEVRRGTPEDRSAPAAEAEPELSTAQLRLQAQLLVAREEARELRGELERAHEDLAATRTALESERERHAADAEQYRRDIAEVQAAAEEAVSAANARVAELGAAAGEAEALRAQVRELEAVAGEAEALRARAGEHERLRTAVGEARAALAAALDRLPAAPDE